ncbi:MAG TPA: YraN family protein [Bryobacteraceae bacterium]|nr:YraN family protein [Bryobacteraceae bacterium]
MLGLLYRAADALRRRAAGGDHGRTGEDLAHRYLRSHGCTIVARNYRPRSGFGEIDLVAWHGPTLAFIEVKTRASEDFGAPETAVDTEKRDRLARAARDYARRAGIEWQRTRFDVVSVVLSRRPRIDWQRDAFGSSGS